MTTSNSHAATPDLIVSCQREEITEDARQWRESVSASTQLLLQSSDDKLLLQEISHLKCLLNQPDLNGSWLLEEEIPEKLLTCLKAHQDIVNFQTIGVDILFSFYENIACLKNKLQEDCYVDYLLHILGAHNNESLQKKGLSYAESMVSKGEKRLLLKLTCRERNILEATIHAVRIFPENLPIQTVALNILLAVLSSSLKNFREEILTEHGCNWLLMSIEKNMQEQSFVLQACKVLNQLVYDGSVDLVLEDGAAKTIVHCFKKYHLNEEVLNECLDVLALFSHTKRAQNIILHELMLVDLLSALMKFTQNACIQTKGFLLFSTLVERWSYECGERSEEGHWLKQVYIGMCHHREHIQLQISGCSALSALLEFCPHLKYLIGEDTDQLPVHNVVIGTLFMYAHEKEVFVSASTALYWLTADNREIQTLMFEKNIYMAVQLSMKTLRSEPRAQEAACMAFRGMCIFNQEYKERIAWHAVTEVIRAFCYFATDLPLHIQALATIACLADTELVRSKCMVEEVYVAIVQYMQEHSDSSLFQEVALEALAILTGAENGIQMLNEVDTLARVLEAMETHDNNLDIQRKGLVLIQLLGESVYIQSHGDLCKGLVTCVVSAMRRHKHSPGVQAEGCVAMQILAESGDRASSDLVKLEAHDCLFYILETYNQNHELQELAGECLYVLCDLRNLKSAMLQYASTKGIIRAVECLVQLGADVNCGSGQDTPLCNACKLPDIETVLYLLANGASDVNNALRLSLDLGNDDVIGALLMHLGFDKPEGVVSWGGLGLGDVHSEWFLPLVEHTYPKTFSCSEIGKMIAAKIRNTEQRRKTRLKSRSEAKADHQEFTRLPLRYSFRRSNNSTTDLQEYLQKLQESQELVEENRFTSSNGSVLSFIMEKLKLFRQQREEESQMRKQRRARKPELIKSYLSRSESFTDTEETPAGFSQTTESISEWKMSTLTGSNVPFNPLDPRRAPPHPFLYTTPQSIPGEWQRRSTYRSKRASSSSDITSESETSAAVQTPSKRKLLKSASSLSLPTMYSATSSGTKDGGLLRHCSRSKTSLSDMESVMPPIPDEDTSGNDVTSSARAHLRHTHGTLRHMGWSPIVDNDIPLRRRVKRTVTMNDMDRLTPETRVLRQVDLSNNLISDLGNLTKADWSLLRHFSSLEKLDLSMNNLHSFPEDLFHVLQSLEHLNLQHNRLVRAPAKALTLPRLKSLDLSHNEITEIGDMAYQNSLSLVDLNLSNNSLRSIPLWFSKALPQLHTLRISSNKIERLPSEAIKLRCLKLIDISHNYLKSLPEHFLQLCINLETLLLQGNELAFLPSEEIAKNLKKLSTVKLKHNVLGLRGAPFLPKFILELPGLRSVDVSNNRLKGLPQPLLWKSQQIRELRLSHNDIRKLDFGEHAKLWVTLERLDISKNKLTELPRELGQLVNLISLDFSYNDITTIPDELGRLTRLYELPLGGLKLDFDESLLKGRVKDLIGYLHEKLKKAVEYYHMKMMLVGFGGRGKSTLLRTLMRQKQPQKSLPTVGVFVRDWKFSGWRNKKIVTYTLSTWDFAGQEDFYCTHQCFLSNRALYLVVYNISRGEEEIDSLGPWLTNIKARAPHCPVIIVGTHLDLVPRKSRDETVRNMRQKIMELCDRPGYPVVRGMTEVDCSRENSAIDRLRILIKEVLDGFKIKGRTVMGQKIPASYVRLQELLSAESLHLSTGLPIIRHTRLLKIVKDAELDLDQDELQHAVKFLHESGVILHYDDATLQLNDLYFINPSWLCRMMAQVVTVREINPFINSHGIMQKENVRMLFTGKRVGDEAAYTFPPSLIPQYLRLLERFEIVLPRSENELLIPSRLPPTKPLIKLPFAKRKDQLIREYRMVYIPSGFWSRLICRLLVFHSKLLLEQFQTEVQDLKYWRDGFYVCYQENAFFLLQTAAEESGYTGLVLTLPATKLGARLLGQAVDHVDTLIDEWYPGLNERYPTGSQLVQRCVLCTHCEDDDECHVFDLEDLIIQSDLEDSVYCPRHGNHVSLNLLAPDIVLGDLADHLTLDPEQFVFVKRDENLLGDGSFGRVYRGRYKNQSVAVKEYLSLGDMHPHVLMRREVAILHRLDHPSLISLLAVGLRPRVLVIELAPHGALGPLVRAGKVHSRYLQHRIALQVAEGLEYLHGQSIVYRDLKMDNVLVFNLNLASPINVKISDYGISRLVTPYGLALSEGTPGYRAPEVIRGEPYGSQSDVYSFGMLLYEVVTGGIHPYNDLHFRSEFDDAALFDRPIDPITQYGAAPWPDLEELLSQCLNQIPEQRPKMSAITAMLENVELLCLNNTVLVSKEDTIQCMAVRAYSEHSVEVWLTSGDDNCLQVSWINLNAANTSIKGKVMSESRALCMLSVTPNMMLIGTEAGRILVFDAVHHRCSHTLDSLPDAVLCLQHFSCAVAGTDHILAGLADGRLAVYNTKQALRSSSASVELIQLGSIHEPVKCMNLHNPTKRLFLGVGSKVVQLQLDPRIDITSTWNTNNHGGRPGLVSQLFLHNKMIHLCKKGQALIEMWNVFQGKLRNTFSTEAFLLKGHCRTSFVYDARVTVITLVQASLWVATASGHVILLDVISYQPITVLHRYEASIRCMVWARVFDKYSAVLVGGSGFKYAGSQDTDSEKLYGVVSIWNSDILAQLHSLKEDRRRRDQNKHA